MLYLAAFLWGCRGAAETGCCGGNDAGGFPAVKTGARHEVKVATG